MRDHLVLYVNATRHTVRGPAAALTLSDFLRNGSRNEHPTELRHAADGFDAGEMPQRRPGTKVACAEGDCGACTVLVGRPSTPDSRGRTARFDYQSIDACIAFVYQMDRCHVVTIEGLQCGAALTDVQRAMIDCHGSQCGFCTPGFVMALHGLIEQRNPGQRKAEQRHATRRSSPLPAAASSHSTHANDCLSDEELRLGLSGNLCRCTGYSQILAAGRSLRASGMRRLDEQFDTGSMLADLANLGAGPVHVNARPVVQQPGGEYRPSPAPEVFLPNTLDELLARRAERPAATLVAGGTDLGVQHNHGKIAATDILVTSGVDALAQLEFDKNELVIGAAVSWSRIEAFVRQRVPEYHQILMRFGSPQVRHAGTLAGNLANASPIADSIPFHYVAGSTIELARIGGRRTVPIEDFYLGYKQLDLQADEVIVSVRTPLPGPRERLKLYKISKRRDMDISTVTAAFWFDMEGPLIRQVRIAAGGVGPTVIRLRQAETAVMEKRLTIESMRNAGRIARDEITPISDVRGSADYRRQLIENLFSKCFHDLSSTLPPLESR